ncbi:uncharacterized protein LOC120699096 isoform X2 [Panicum virgatum]|uniref:uncharacterized protein LOC120699096 isoform X2 n=1 Tax=Panicum virgatum TaxID=38727 RepID=UPI0019D68B37|nr:uncharacterized protein LOC120699096 isoform X2 [Panicum virgatum]
MQQLLKQGQTPSPALADPDRGDAAASSATQALPSRNVSSKYDFVKVKVWLGENADHYYVLSRFLLSRMLTVTKIPNHVAIKIALELKKLLVDNSLLDVSQSDLEANLFKLMEKRGYGEDYINRYKMMTRFHHQRVPLVILVCGTACTGKSTIATQLAQRLNLPNVLQTDMVYELLRTSTEECRVVRKGLAGDLKKAMKDGKPIIIEGIHLDPSIYLMDEEKRDDNSRTEKTIPDSENSGISVESKTEHQSKNGLAENRISLTKENENFVKIKDCTLEEGRISEGVSYAESHETVTHDSAHSQEKNPRDESDGHKDLGQSKNYTAKKDKPAAEPIVVPIVLRMSDFDHKALLEEWIATRAFRDNCLPQDHRKLINNLKLIQDYLCSFESQGLTIVDISANSFPQTLDWLHSYLLQISATLCLQSTTLGDSLGRLGGKTPTGGAMGWSSGDCARKEDKLEDERWGLEWAESCQCMWRD